MKIKTNVPPPVVQPEPTFDLLGLTSAEVKIIRHCLDEVNLSRAGRKLGVKSDSAYTIHSQLFDIDAEGMRDA